MYNRKVTKSYTINGARIFMKNFSGEERDKNPKGNRNFALYLDDEQLVEELVNDGWPVKWFPPREGDPDQRPQAWMKIKIKFRYPPDVYLVTRKGKKKLTEHTIGQLDMTNIAQCDLTFSPYNYDASSVCPAGVSAYLREMYVVKSESELSAKYSNIDDIDDISDPNGDDGMPFEV